MNVMAKAWEIAKEGQKKFGGKVKEYFAEALRLAWSLIKKGGKVVKAILETSNGSRKHKTWVAKITGKHDTYKFDREFVKEKEDDGWNKFFELTDGVYDVCDGGNRKYIKVTAGTIEEISELEIAEMIN